MSLVDIRNVSTHQLSRVSVCPWRMNLVAVSSETSTLFVGSLHSITCFSTERPVFPFRTLEISSIEATDINALRIGYLGQQEVLAAVNDLGTAAIFFTADLDRPQLTFDVVESAWGISTHAGRYLLAVSSNSHKITVFFLGSSIEQHSQAQRDPIVLQGHAHNVPSIDFSESGEFIASASVDSSCCIWHVDSGSMLFKKRLCDEWGWCVRFIPRNAIDATTKPELNYSAVMQKQHSSGREEQNQSAAFDDLDDDDITYHEQLASYSRSELGEEHYIIPSYPVSGTVIASAAYCNPFPDSREAPQAFKGDEPRTSSQLAQWTAYLASRKEASKCFSKQLGLRASEVNSDTGSIRENDTMAEDVQTGRHGVPSMSSISEDDNFSDGQWENAALGEDIGDVSETSLDEELRQISGSESTNDSEMGAALSNTFAILRTCHEHLIFATRRNIYILDPQKGLPVLAQKDRLFDRRSESRNELGLTSFLDAIDRIIFIEWLGETGVACVGTQRGRVALVHVEDGEFCIDCWVDNGDALGRGMGMPIFGLHVSKHGSHHSSVMTFRIYLGELYQHRAHSMLKLLQCTTI
ncbi:hypothetical protein BJ742DRAFT_795036 [Cladochytrium replicatum]|nr:hypothetical protein BJ742DRAFT_795036 [Cladochytrium replicatum]